MTMENAEKMPECFGLNFGWFDNIGVPEYEKRELCFHCPHYERCYQMAAIGEMRHLRAEIRTGVRGLRNSLGGSHSEYPLM